MKFKTAYQLNSQCALALVYLPTGEYAPEWTSEAQDQHNAHIQATLTEAKRVMVACAIN